MTTEEVRRRLDAVTSRPSVVVAPDPVAPPTPPDPQEQGVSLLSRLGGLGKQILGGLVPSPISRIGSVLDQLPRPLEAGTETILTLFPKRFATPEQAERTTRAEEVLSRTGRVSPLAQIQELSEIHRERPLVQQIGAGVLIDPFLAFGLAKGAAKAIPAVARQFKAPARAVPQAAAEPVVQKVVSILKGVKPAVGEVTREQAREQAARIGQFGEQVARGVEEGATPTVQSIEAARRATLAGPLEATRAPFGAIAENVTPAEVDELIGLVYKFDDVPKELLNNSDAFIKTFVEGKIPEPADLNRLEAIFGPEMTDEIVRIGKLGPDAWQTALDAANLPRAAMASFDMSAVARQGWTLLAGHPIQAGRSFGRMLKIMLSESNAAARDAAIMGHRNFETTQQMGIFFGRRAGTGTTVKATQQEERFIGRFTRIFPWIRVSERAHVGFLNELRHSVAFKIIDDWEAAGKTLANSPDDYKWLGRFINYATGRGPLPGRLAGQKAILGAAFFSARLNTAHVAKFSPLVAPGVSRQLRLLVAKDLAASYGTSMALLGMMAAAGAKVGKDILSSDFGKAKLGNMRFDFFAGILPMVRLVAQIVAGEKRTSAANLQDVTWQETTGRYIASKLSPQAGIVLEIIRGETFLGEEVRATPEFIGSRAWQNLSPLAIQDIVDAVRIEGAKGLLATGAIVGFGINTYETFGDVLNDVAQAEFGQTWRQVKEEGDPNKLAKVSGSELVQKFADEQKAKRKPELRPIQQLRDRQELYEQRTTEMEQVLASQIVAGRKGNELRKAVREFKADRAKLWGGLFTEELEVLQKRNREDFIVLTLRDRYWDIDLEEDLRTGELDFAKWEIDRESVLLEADAMEVERDFLTTRRPDRFDDPDVRRVVEQYENDMEIMRLYFRVPERIIRDPTTLYQYRIREDIPRDRWPAALKKAEKDVREERQALRRRSRLIQVTGERWGIFGPVPRR